MNQAEYVTFMQFWKFTISMGDDIFILELLDGHLASPKIVQLSGQGLRSSFSGGIWTVASPAQIVGKNPFLFVPIIEIEMSDSSSLSLRESDYAIKEVTVYFSLPDGNGGEITHVTDGLVAKDGGGYENLDVATNTYARTAEMHAVRETTLRISPVADTSEMSHIVDGHTNVKTVTRHGALYEETPDLRHVNESWDIDLDAP